MVVSIVCLGLSLSFVLGKSLVTSRGRLKDELGIRRAERRLPYERERSSYLRNEMFFSWCNQANDSRENPQSKLSIH